VPPGSYRGESATHSYHLSWSRRRIWLSMQRLISAHLPCESCGLVSGAVRVDTCVLRRKQKCRRPYHLILARGSSEAGRSVPERALAPLLETSPLAGCHAGAPLSPGIAEQPVQSGLHFQPSGHSVSCANSCVTAATSLCRAVGSIERPYSAPISRVSAATCSAMPHLAQMKIVTPDP
jgi:hypothetical protein